SAGQKSPQRVKKNLQRHKKSLQRNARRAFSGMKEHRAHEEAPAHNKSQQPERAMVKTSIRQTASLDDRLKVIKIRSGTSKNRRKTFAKAINR
ncbi:MAG: hypothetical protein AAF513_20365, partial [Pseudomonadota bacterium]